MSEKSSKCPVCQSDIESETLINEVTPKIEEIKKDLNSLETWKKECDEISAAAAKNLDRVTRLVIEMLTA